MRERASLILATALILGACGEGDSADSVPPSATGSTAVVTSPATQPTPTQHTLPPTVVPLTSEPPTSPEPMITPTSTRAITLGELLDEIEATWPDDTTAQKIVGCRLVDRANSHYDDFPLTPDSLALDRGMIFTCVIQGDPPGDYGEPLIVALDRHGTYTFHSATDGTQTLPFESPPGLLCREFLADPMLAGWLDEESYVELGYPAAAYTLVLAYWFIEGRPARMDVDGDGIPCELLFPPDVVSTVLAGG